MAGMPTERAVMQRLEPWHGHCNLQFSVDRLGRTRHQGGCSAPFKVLRTEAGNDNRCELPLLHTAGGLVGGDQLSIDLKLQTNSRSLITSVAAQKVYGSIGRSRLDPEGAWASQTVRAKLAEHSDLEWLPQELVLYADALFEQNLEVQLPQSASFLSVEIVRLGRTAAAETLKRGRWKTGLCIQRTGPTQTTWELVDRIELGGESLMHNHGLSGAPVFGSFVWAAPEPMTSEATKDLLNEARNDREDLEGIMRCSSLNQGIVARYVGHSSRDARFWFSRLWARTRRYRSLCAPSIPRVWPIQEDPFKRRNQASNLDNQ